MSALLTDLRSALRQFSSRPGTTLLAVLALSAGIGGATAIFSVVDATLLRPLPYPRASELVRIWERRPEGGDFPTAEPTYLDFRDRTRVFDVVAAMRIEHLNLTGAGEPARLDAAAVSASLLPMLGAEPTHGRLFTAADDGPDGASRVAVLGNALWRQRFSGDASIVGRTIMLDGESYTVRGVLAERFAFAPAVQLWLPLGASPSAERDNRGLDLIARMKRGIPLSEAHGDLARVARELGAEHPRSNAGWGVRVASFSDWLLGESYRRTVWVLFGAVGCLLLLACANVANLLLAQGVAREGELGVRGALGASRGRVTRQLLTESLLLALAGGVGGVLIAVWGATALGTLSPQGVTRFDGVALDGRLLAFTLGVATLTAIVFGLVPARRAARVDITGILATGARLSGTVRGRNLRDVLVVAQVALAVVLLAGAGLMLGSFRRLANVETGMADEHVLTTPLQLPERSYTEGQRQEFVRRAVERTAALPGVQAAAATVTNPFREYGYANDVTPVDRAASVPPSGLLVAGWRSVTPDFFRTLGIPVLSGRAFGDHDRDGAERVVLVSASLAELLWPGAEAVGRSLFWGGTDGSPKRVVGVVGDVRDRTLDAEPEPMLYLPYAQVPVPTVTLVLRADGGPERFAAAVRGIIWAIDPNLPVPEVTPLASNREALAAGPRFRALLLACFAGVALLLAALGVYGVMAFAVAQRTREIGVRMALGARPAAVAREVLARGLALTAVGVGIGLAASVALGRLAESLLYETSPSDAPTLAAVALLVAATALVATWLPSRRATRVDPVQTLRAG